MSDREPEEACLLPSEERPPPFEVPQADISGMGVAGGGLTSPVPVVPAAGGRQGRDWLPPPRLAGPYAAPAVPEGRRSDRQTGEAGGQRVEGGLTTRPIRVVPPPAARAGRGDTGLEGQNETLFRVTSRPDIGRPNPVRSDAPGTAPARAEVLAEPSQAGEPSRALRPKAAPAPATPPAVYAAPTPVRLSEDLSVMPAWSSSAAARRWGWQSRARQAGRPASIRAGVSSARNAGIMAAGTVLSRVTGFARFLAVAWVLGQGHLADAYNQANTVPNTVYDLLLGGVLSATLLPVLMQSMTRAAARGAQNEDEDAVPAVVTSLTVFLIIATAVFYVAAPLIIDFYLALASGRAAGPERALATSWLRLFSPQLLFIGLITISTALLNARRRFMAVAFSPVLANLVTIAALAVADHLVSSHTVAAFRATPKAVLVVGLGTTAGYLVQLLAQIPSLLKAGIALRFLFRPRHPVLERIVRLSGWTIGAVATNQASFALVSVLANRHAGNYSSFTYSYQFMLLPYSVIAVSIAAAMAPELAELWARGERRAFGRRVSSALRATLALILPAGLGYALLARRVSVLAVAHGALGLHQALSTGTLLALFALGLPGFSCYLLMMRAFQSQQDARSMFWLYVLENGLTIVAALVLYPLFGVTGLVVAWMGSYTAVLPLVWLRLRISADIYISAEWWARVGIATVFMAVVVLLVDYAVPSPASFLARAAHLLLAVVAGAAAYLYSSRLVGVPEVALFNRRISQLAHLVRGASRSRGRSGGMPARHSRGAGAD